MELFKALALLLATTTASSAADSAAEGGSCIFNGDNVTKDIYPWFTYPLNSTGLWDGCGASLNSVEYILTAAHCIVDENKTLTDSMVSYTIGALCAPYTQGHNCGQDIEEAYILESTIHPSYKNKNKNYDNNFALIKLEKDASTSPVNIDDGTYSPIYANGKGNLYAIGFGNATLDDYSGEYYFPERLQDVELKYITNAKCVPRIYTNENSKDYIQPL